MAQKRMFSLAVTDTDKFLDMSASAQALYFHLGMHGDDDGFVASPKKIARGVGCNDDDLRLLASKGYIIPFESGVIVIVDWNINNTLKNDRYHKTIFAAERALVSEDSAGRWVLGSSMVPDRKQLASSLEPEHIEPYPGISQRHVCNSGDPNNRAQYILFEGAIGRAYTQLYTPILPYKDELSLRGFPCRCDTLSKPDARTGRKGKNRNRRKKGII